MDKVIVETPFNEELLLKEIVALQSMLSSWMKPVQDPTEDAINGFWETEGAYKEALCLLHQNTDDPSRICWDCPLSPDSSQTPEWKLLDSIFAHDNVVSIYKTALKSMACTMMFLRIRKTLIERVAYYLSVTHTPAMITPHDEFDRLTNKLKNEERVEYLFYLTDKNIGYIIDQFDDDLIGYSGRAILCVKDNSDLFVASSIVSVSSILKEVFDIPIFDFPPIG